MPRAKRTAADEPVSLPVEAPSALNGAASAVVTEPPEGAPPLPAEEDAPAVFAAEEVGAAAPAPAPQKRSRSRRAAPEMPAAPEAAPAAEAPVSEVAPKSRSRKRRAEAAETAAPPPREESAAPTDVPPLSAVGDLAAAPERIDTAPPAPDLGAAAAERSARPVARPSEKEPIASLENERVRMVRSLHEKRHRDELGAFLIEGVRLVEEALSAGADIPLVLYDPEAVSRNSRARQLIDALGDVAIPVTDRVLRSVADTQTPQGIVGMVRVPEPAEAAPTGRLVLVLDAVQDPGNVGTILRAAVASGVNAVIIGPDCADVYSPKVVRAAMGAHFHLDLFTGLDWPQIDRMTAGRQRLVGAPVGGRVYYQVDWTRPTALIISNEAAGPSLGALRLAGGPGNGKVSIPIVGAADSLNAAVAAGVLLFEASRQVSERRGQQERGARHDRGQRPNLGRNTPFRDGPPQRDGGWRPGFDRHSGGRPFGGGQGSRPYPAGGAPRRPSDFDDEPPFRGGPPRGGRPGGGGRPSNPRPPYRGGGGRDR